MTDSFRLSDTVRLMWQAKRPELARVTRDRLRTAALGLAGAAMLANGLASKAERWGSGK